MRARSAQGLGALGLRLKHSCIVNGTALQDIARRAGLKVSKLSDLMRAKTAATPEEAERLADVIDGPTSRSLYRALAAADRGFVRLHLALTGDARHDSSEKGWRSYERPAPS